VSRHEDVRTRAVAAPPAALWQAVEGMHSEGYSGPVRLVWAARGLADRALGGVGTRRGRRDPDRLEVGDPLDFWLVAGLVRGERLLLRAQMRLPGTATLELGVSGAGASSVLTARAICTNISSTMTGSSIVLGVCVIGRPLRKWAPPVSVRSPACSPWTFTVAVTPAVCFTPYG